MQSKLQELTDKIYQEGIAKGNAEAEQIVTDAKKEAGTIIENAKKEAESILESSRKKADELKTNTESEIKLSAKQALNALKQQITDLINLEVVKLSVDKKFDKDFIKQIVETTLKNWSSSSEKTMDLVVLLPEKDEKDLFAYFAKSVKSLIDKGLELKFDAKLRNGFQITPKDGSYKISFTEEDFTNFFRQYLRPRLSELLFSE